MVGFSLIVLKILSMILEILKFLLILEFLNIKQANKKHLHLFF